MASEISDIPDRHVEGANEEQFRTESPAQDSPWHRDLLPLLMADRPVRTTAAEDPLVDRHTEPRNGDKGMIFTETAARLLILDATVDRHTEPTSQGKGILTEIACSVLPWFATGGACRPAHELPGINAKAKPSDEQSKNSLSEREERNG